MENQETGVLDPVAEGQVDEVQEQEVISDKEMNFKALRDELSQMKNEKEKLEQNFDQWKRELARESRQPARAEAPPKRFIDDIPDDNYLTAAQLKAVLKENERIFQEELARKEADHAITMNEVIAKARYSDYDEVVSKYGIPLIENEPELADAFLASKNKPGYLYKLGKMAMNGQTKVDESQVRRSEQAKTLVANSNKPRTLSGEVSGAQKMNPVDYYASMSDADFSKLIRKNLGEI